MPNKVNGVGPLNAKLLIVGEAPGKYEDELGIPFSGPTGAMLNEFLLTAGIHRSECYLTNVVKYRPPMNDLKKLHLINVDIGQQMQELWDNEINVLNPNVILAVGDLALQAVTGFSGILNYRGSILRARNGKFKVVPTIHPAALFSRYGEDKSGGLDYVYSKLIQADITRAVEESSFPEYNLPERNLSVANNSLDVFRFFSQYESSEKVAFDIESINCIPVCVGFAFNRHYAISIPLLKSIGSNILTNMGDNDLVDCWRMIDKILQTKKLIGHNLKYDEFKLSLAGFTCKNIYSDTLIKTRVIFPELPNKQLHTVSSLWTREPYYKEEGKEFKLGKSNINQLFLYNAKDCAVEFEVDEEQEKDLISMAETFSVPLVDYYYNYMMKKHKFYLTMENNGFAVDKTVQDYLKIKYSALEKEQHSKLVNLIGFDVNVKSPPQKIQLFKSMGMVPYKINPTSEDAIVKMIGNHCKGKNGQRNKEILETVLEETRIRDQRSRYINFCPDYDGRCKSAFNISATETCRSSTSILKKPVRPKKIGLAFHTISKHGRLAKDIRSMFIPDKGKVFIQADSSQAEARVVAVLSKDWDLLEAFDKIDIHRRTAGLIFGLTKILDLKTPYIKGVDDLEKDGVERFTGKTTRHAGNYLMGKARHMTEFNTAAQKAGMDISISEWKAGQNLKLFHEASPKLSSNFHRDIQLALQSSRVLIDPFGGVRVFNGRMEDDLFKEGYANIPQRTVAHLVQGAALKITEEAGSDIRPVSQAEIMLGDTSGVNWLSENHDSLLMQVPENNWEIYARLLKKHMEAVIDFNLYCTLKRDYKLIIPCDIEISDTSYAEMRKVKL